MIGGRRRVSLWELRSELHEATVADGRRTLVFSHFDDTGKQHGPFVEHRPPDEDTHQRMAEHWAAYAAEVFRPDGYETMQSVIDGALGAGSYDGLRTALYEAGAASVELGAMELDVRPVGDAQVQDMEPEIRAAVEARLGPGRYDAVKAVLAAMGLPAVTVWRRAELRTG